MKAQIEVYPYDDVENKELTRQQIIKVLRDHDYTDTETINECFESGVHDVFSIMAFLGY